MAEAAKDLLGAVGDELSSNVHEAIAPKDAVALRNRLDKSITLTGRRGLVSSAAASSSVVQPIHPRLSRHSHLVIVRRSSGKALHEFMCVIISWAQRVLACGNPPPPTSLDKVCMEVGTPGANFQASRRAVAHVAVMASSSRSLQFTSAAPYRNIGKRHASITCSSCAGW
eukprot:1207100-Rhodomonas_salina.5